jgi:S1-C subfamily serine protease
MGTNAAFVTDPAHGGLSPLRTEWMHLTQGAGRDTSGVAGKWRNVLAKVVFAGAASIASAACASMVSAGEPADAILKIYATQLVSDYGAPWRSAASRTVSGSGFVVAGRRILTNAHVVSDATFIQVRRHGESERFAARVLHVSHDADLAVLTVDEPGFFDSLTPLSLGGLPELREEVLVLGFPVGGDTLSATRGVVSRIEHQVYVHNRTELLAGQIDGAVNPGNSGGPVLAQGKVVGVAMQTAVGADNVAYMIPIPVLDHFLTDVADGRYDGVPAVPFRWQRLEAADLRRRYALPPSKTGVLVLETMVGSAAAGVLRAGDVLLSIDGRTVGTDGTIEFRPRERTALSFLLQERQLGERVDLELLRDGRILRDQLLLDHPNGAGRVVRGPVRGERPRYYIFGGLTFCPVTVNYVQAWGEQWPTRAPRHLTALLDRPARFEGEEAVVLCSVLRAEQNSGYEDAAENLIVEADGQSVRSLRHLVEIIESGEAGLLALETQNGEQIVLDRERAGREGPAILAQYQVPSDRSEDLIGGGKVQRYVDGSRRQERPRVQRALATGGGSAGRLVDAGSRP